MAKTEITDAAAPQTVEELRAQLAQADLRISELAAQNAALAESSGSSQGAFERAMGPSTRHKRLWKFRVTSNDTKLPAREVKATDESEAVRQYVLIASGDSSRPLDTVKYIFKAECLEPVKRMNFGREQHDIWRQSKGYGSAPQFNGQQLQTAG